MCQRYYFEFSNDEQALRFPYFGPNPYMPEIPFAPPHFQFAHSVNVGLLTLPFQTQDELPEEEYKKLLRRCQKAHVKWQHEITTTLYPRWKKVIYELKKYRMLLERQGYQDPELKQRMKDKELAIWEDYRNEDAVEKARKQHEKAMRQREEGRRAAEEGLSHSPDYLPFLRVAPAPVFSPPEPPKVEGPRRRVPIIQGDALLEYLDKQGQNNNAEPPLNGYDGNWYSAMKRAFEDA
ncbi:hypothetical protein L596_025882 [Steinernema carpocapsae]|uniref:Uncharacterized protein n=1 Tax=Steinernema carpocapsae TaxID=34508 RepID=A0A4U5M939_STECR|nr:hypothetical protein L596_025882 [Steinernema carpocapsae]